MNIWKFLYLEQRQMLSLMFLQTCTFLLGIHINKVTEDIHSYESSDAKSILPPKVQFFVGSPDVPDEYSSGWSSFCWPNTYAIFCWSVIWGDTRCSFWWASKCTIIWPNRSVLPPFVQSSGVLRDQHSSREYNLRVDLVGPPDVQSSSSPPEVQSSNRSPDVQSSRRPPDVQSSWPWALLVCLQL